MEESIDGFDKKLLHLKTWIPKCRPRAVILLIHSVSDHINRYKYLADYFSENGFVVMGIDMHGCGKSEGKKGMAKFKHMLCDVKQLIEYAHSRYPNLPKVIYGHGLGGNLALTYATRNNSSLMAVISSSPWIRKVDNQSHWFISIVRVILWVYPALSVRNRLHYSALSHDTDCLNAYKKDPMVNHFISAKLLFSIQKSGDYLIHNKHKVNMPLLLMHGSNDSISSWRATADFAKYTSFNTTLKIWKGAYHELHNECEKEDIFEFMLHWIDHLPGIH